MTIQAKRWPWSRAEVVTLAFDGRSWFWFDTGTELTLAPLHVFRALMRAVND